MSTPFPEMTIEAIRSVPLFGSLDDQAARDLLSLLSIRQVSSGTALFCAGDAGDAMYLIENGRVEISITDEDQKRIILADLAQGDFFGEMAIIDGKQRSADATVTDETRLAVLSRDNFLRFIQDNPKVALEMLSATFGRLRRTDKLLTQRVSRNVNEEQKKRETIADRAADMIAEFGGSWTFIGAAVGFLIFWVLLNTWLLRGKGFDPFPYVLLNLVLGMITGMQAPIIMMSQNRQSGKDRLRADLDFQVNLKNEIALTEVLRRLDVLESERLPQLFAQQNEKIEQVKTSDPIASRQSAP